MKTEQKVGLGPRELGHTWSPTHPPDVYFLHSYGLGTGMKPEDEEQTSVAFIPEAKR